MNTLLSCLCDSMLARFCGECKSIIKIQEACTNDQDKCIVFLTCASIVLVAFIAAVTVIILKWQENHAKIVEQKENKEKEKEECERKLKSDLLNKYLDFLKEAAYKDDRWGQHYKEVLASFKEALQNETKDSGASCYSTNGSDIDKIISILDKQMEYIKSKCNESNTDAEEKYKRALAYLIEKAEKEDMKQITMKELMGEQEGAKASSQNPN